MSVAPSTAFSAEVLQTQTEHIARLAAEPSAGTPLLIDFNNLPFGTELDTQFSAQQGIEFSSPSSSPLLILPEAFGSFGIPIPPSECPPPPLPCLPRLAVLTGLEAGFRLHINVTSPEDAAAELRGAGAEIATHDGSVVVRVQSASPDSARLQRPFGVPIAVGAAVRLTVDASSLNSAPARPEA